MKNVWLVVCLGVVSSLVSYAQPKEEMAKMRFEKMSQELQLSDDQKLKIEEINDQYGNQIKALKNAEGENEAELKRLRKERQSKVKEVLSKEQIVKMDSIRKEHKKKGGEVRKEINQYKKEVMLPVLKVHRLELEKTLTDDEKRIITDLRSRQSMLRKEAKMMKNHRDGQEEKEKSQGKGREVMIQKRHQMFQKDCKEKLKPIIEAHQTELNIIESNLEPQRIEWEAHIRSIREKHMGDLPDKTSDEKMALKRDEMKKIHFLLLDPNSAEEED